MNGIPVVHAVTNDEVILDAGFLSHAEQVMRAAGPRGAIHLRARSLTPRTLYETALSLIPLERETGTLLVVNDRIDVACAAGIRYVQLTSRSMSAAEAQRVAPDLVIGASVHGPDEAAAAQAAGAAWCVAGTAFPTASHPGSDAGGVALIRSVCDVVTIPVIAIGGVVPEHVPDVLDAGAYGIAAISGIWRSSDVAAAVRRYLSAYDGYKGAR